MREQVEHVAAWMGREPRDVAGVVVDKPGDQLSPSFGSAIPNLLRASRRSSELNSDR